MKVINVKISRDKGQKEPKGLVEAVSLFIYINVNIKTFNIIFVFQLDGLKRQKERENDFYVMSGSYRLG